MFNSVRLIALITIIPFLLDAQTITSKTSGGNWNDPNTWIGGVIPNQNNDVVIDGSVLANNNVCNNLTINSGGTLQAASPGYCCYEYTLTIMGNVINNGMTRNNPDGNWLALKVSGDITNNNSWKHTRTDLMGNADQHLTSAQNKIFESAFKVTDSVGGIIANSALEFSQSIDLNGCILNMNNNSLTLNGASATVFNGRVINTGDLVGHGSPTLYNISYEGSPNIKGLFQAKDAVVIGTLTVVDTLQSWSPGYCCYEYFMRITGDVINNGVIRNDPYGNRLTLIVTGNITNNNSWTHTRTDLTGSGDQHLTSSQNKIFESAFNITDSLGAIIANSALEFSLDVNLNGCILDMQNNSLTLNGGSATVFNGRVINTGDLVGRGSPTLYNITYEGSPNIKGLFMAKDAAVKGTLTVVDTLRSWSPGYCCYEYFLRITGDVINNGVIQNDPYGNRLTLIVSGNITNNNSWKHTRTDLVGNADQHLTSAQNKIFESAFKVTDSLGTIIANSALEFSQDINLNSCILDMQNNSLTLNGGSATVYNGRVINTGDLVGRGSPTLDNITYEGYTNIKGLFQAKDATIKGTLTVVDTLQSWSPGYCCYEYPLTVTGDVINNGVIRNDPNGNRLALKVSGNITNNSKWIIGATRLIGSGKRTLIATGIQGAIEATGANVILTGNNILPRLTVNSDAYCEVDGDGYLQFLEETAVGNLINKGKVILTKAIKTTGDYSFFAIKAKLTSIADIDSLTIESYGNQIPFSFSNGVKRWWRIKQTPATMKTTYNTLTFYYSDSELGSNNESSLQVFYSDDSAKTWKQISISSNITRNTTENYLAISDAPGEGDYLLSSSADPTSVSPSIITAVIGSSNIRVGAPTRLKIQYVNNSDVSAEDFFITVNTGKKVHIKSVEIPLEGGGFMSLPKDSLFYNNEDTTLAMYALKMAPREERTFDIIVTGDVPMRGKTTLSNVLFIDPVSITAAAAITWVAWKAGTYVICKGIDYLGDKAVAGLKMTPEEQSRYDQMVKGGIPTELKERPGALKSFAVKTVGTQILKKTLDLAPGGASAAQITYTVTQNVSKVAPTLRQRIFNWFYKETGLYGVETTDNGNAYQPQVSTVTQKKGTLVTSWDPNEKVGPSGYGDQKFITSAGKMTYQILFENKKEATAPAYKIVIVDTLLSEFDPETVQFGRTSHEGPQYQWNISRTGNILRWEIEGIELPPNVNPPEGEGWVSLTISPKSGLASGTDLKNKATIVFDLNKPITTNEHSNRLDFSPPTTTMNQLPQSINNNSFTVKWQSNDGAEGVGVESATVFMSVDNGPFNMAGTSNSDSLIVKALTETHTYSFYALANDFVGNVETVHPTASITQVINSVDAPNNEIPKNYLLAQNYPNPFNPSTTIQYSLKEGGKVDLAVYNLLGQKVISLVNEYRNPGNHVIKFDASRLASGIYIYQIRANNFSTSKKLILLK